MPTIERGMVVWVDLARGFGFIRRSNSAVDLFAHCDDVQNGGQLAKGRVVEYVPSVNPRNGRPRAYEIRVIGGGDSMTRHSNAMVR